MAFCRIIGWTLIVLAVAVLGNEGVLWLSEGEYEMMVLGKLWHRIDAASLVNAQAGVQRYLSPWLWEKVIQEILLWPASAVFGVPGVVLAVLCRHRRRTRIF